MIVPIVILVVSFFLDGILSNFFPYIVGDLSLFTPMITIVSFVIIYPFFVKRKSIYFLCCFITGLFYDFMYTNLLFYNAILFLILGFVIFILYKYIQPNWFTILLFIVLVIVSYECLNAIIILIFQLVPMTFSRLIYKISHSLLLNLIYGEILYLIVLLLPKRFKRISIN